MPNACSLSPRSAKTVALSGVSHARCTGILRRDIQPSLHEPQGSAGLGAPSASKPQVEDGEPSTAIHTAYTTWSKRKKDFRKRRITRPPAPLDGVSVVSVVLTCNGKLLPMVEVVGALIRTRRCIEMARNALFLCLCVVLAYASLAGAWSQEPATSTATERVLGKVDLSSWMEQTVAASPDATRVAYVARAGEKQFVIVDGQKGKRYDEIGEGRIGPLSITFSPDSKRVAYVARSGGRWFVVVDGQEGKRYDEIDKSHIPFSILFSADSKRIAYRARTGNEWVVVVDGQESKRYAGVGSWEVHYTSRGVRCDVICGPPLVFSPDGTRVAYMARTDNEWFVVVDGQEGKHYANTVLPMAFFSPDSKRTAYWGRVGDRWYAVVDGKEGTPHDGPGIATMAENDQLAILSTNSLVFSPDSTRIAYVAQEGDEEPEFAVVVDGQEWSRYDYVDPRGPVFSPDSTRIAHIARSEDNEFKASVVLDKERGTPYEDVVAPLFSPDSRRMAYAASDGAKWFVVLDGQEAKPYDDIGTPYFSARSTAGLIGVPGSFLFSPDSRRLAYGATVGDKRLVVVDGEEGKQYDEIGTCSLVFSPDSRRIAYTAKAGEKWLVVVDGQEGKQYDEIAIRSLVFSSDSRKLAYLAKAGGKWLVVVEGREGKQYDDILTRAVFDSADSFHYIAIDGDTVYLVEEKLD